MASKEIVEGAVTLRRHIAEFMMNAEMSGELDMLEHATFESARAACNHIIAMHVKASLESGGGY